MSITLKYFLHPKEVITMQYPDEKWEMPPRYRGFHSVAFEGKEACVGCLQCQKICTEHSIFISTSMGSDNKRKIHEFFVNLGTCSFCGNCQDVCPTKAIKLGGEYEGAVLEKNLLMLDKKKLQRSAIPERKDGND
ncbi:MAG: NADH-quinone oxidoreductase subunit I [Candidatus Riflebacteria bacterium]|nr:NADH-quinone oxidoreductase subunit I [Candidatus Riflebacteria bacterium]